jgi:tetratricopeptide (TPR) repeat protein
VQADNEMAALVAAPGVSIDVVEFRRLLQETRRHDHPAAAVCARCRAPLMAAAELARGDFLEGFTLRDAPEFDDWQSLTTTRLRNSLADCLRRLAEAHRAAGDLAAARDAAGRWAGLDPLDQAAAEQLMLLHAWNDDHAAALRVYRDLERALRSELGAAPEPQLTALFAAIKEQREPPPPTRPADGGTVGSARESAGRSAAPAAAPALPAFLADDADGLPPLFVAREHELAALDAHLHAACQGQGRVVFITGEAGEGKTALLHAFVRRAVAAHPALTAAGGSCNAYTGTGDPYLPFREVLELLAGNFEARLSAGSLPRAQALRLWRMMPDTTRALLQEGADLLPTFVALRPLLLRSAQWLDEPARRALEAHIARAPVFDPMLQQASLFAQFTAVLARLAAQAPLLLTIDDLQWGDAGSLALLFHLSRRLAGTRILVVAAYRPNDVALGRGGERHPLEPIVHEVLRAQGDSTIDLSQAEERAFVDALLDSEPNRLDAAFRDELLRRTGGHALFTSELLRGMQERGDLRQDAAGRWVAQPALDWEQLPARVEAVIGERLARLPAALRDLLAAASVEGEEFSAELAAHLAGIDPSEARRRLSSEGAREHRLVAGLGVQRIGDTRLTRFRFHHFLIQRGLYAGLDAAERAAYNEDAGLWLEEVYAGQTEEIAVALAHHFAAAGLAEKAITYYQQAGDRALRFSANPEAAQHYGRALALLAELPATPARLQQEFALQAWYSVPIQHLEGWASPRADAAFERALELARLFGNPPISHPLLGRIAHAWVYRGEHRRALGLAQELLELATTEEEDAGLLEAHTVVGLTHFYMGEFAAAQPHLELAVGLYDRERHAALTYVYGQDAGVHAGLYRMLNLTMLGYMDQGRAQAASTIALAEAVGHPFTLAFAWSFVAFAGALALDVDMMEQAARKGLEVARAHAFPTWMAFCLTMGGYTRAMRGELEEGFADGMHGLEIALPTGAQTSVAFIFGLMSDLQAAMGQREEALSFLDIAHAMAEQNEEGMSIPDLHRRRGALLLELGHSWAEADAALRQAIAFARSRAARLHELRALTTRLRLARTYAPAEVAAAYQELQSAYAWFTEGFDAPDLVAARAELAHG